MNSQVENKNSLKKPIFWGCGSAIAVVVIIIIALFAYFTFSPEFGVKMKN